MIVKYREDLVGGPHHRTLATGESTRLLVRADGVGFTLTDFTMEPGSDATLQYKNHVECNYIVEGEGTLDNLETGDRYAIRPGIMFTLDKHERHRVRAKTRIRIIVVFVPALVGSETHDADGSYPLL
ncbi:MAG: ectoine synthase [Alphaproteobacteria bacterium]